MRLEQQRDDLYDLDLDKPISKDCMSPLIPIMKLVRPNFKKLPRKLWTCDCGKPAAHWLEVDVGMKEEVRNHRHPVLIALCDVCLEKEKEQALHEREKPKPTATI
jgi:hypothetical protein